MSYKELVKRLRDAWIPEDTIRARLEAADALEAQEKRIAELERERDAANDMAGVLRHELLHFAEGDCNICEGCGAPLDHGEEISTVADVMGCWPYVVDDPRGACYRYRTAQGMERSWPDYQPTLAAAIRNLGVSKS